MPDKTPMQLRDETAATYFESGWNAAIREVALQRQHDRLDDFMHEQRRALGGGDK